MFEKEKSSGKSSFQGRIFKAINPSKDLLRRTRTNDPTEESDINFLKKH